MRTTSLQIGQLVLRQKTGVRQRIDTAGHHLHTVSVPEVHTLTGASLNRRLGIPLSVSHYTRGSYTTHYHRFLELMILNADGGHNVIGRRRTAFRRGQVYQLGMFHPHRVEGPDGGRCDYFNIGFQPEAVVRLSGRARDAVIADPILAPFYSTVPAEQFVLPETEHERVVSICGSLLEETTPRDRYSASIALGQFQALLGIVARHRSVADVATDGRVQTVLRTITERFDEPLQTRDLAEMVGASPSRLAQIFREYTGTTVRQALLRRRLTESKRLLATSDMHITELLHISGFNDVSYFNRAFRADAGVTPREYRRRAQGPQSEPTD